MDDAVERYTPVDLQLETVAVHPVRPAGGLVPKGLTPNVKLCEGSGK